VAEALALGAALALVAFALVLSTNRATVLWSFVALAISVAYPYAKRFVSMPQAVLGVAFSFGIPMAFAAVRGGDTLRAAWHRGEPLWPALWGGDSLGVALMTAWGSVPPLAWVLLLGNLFWVLAYDTEYAMVDRDDDLRIGMKTSAITLGRLDVPVVLACYAIYLGIWAAALVDIARSASFLLALGVAAAQAVWHGLLIRKRSREGCFKAFRLNHWLGFTVFAGVALSYGLR
jgi:4-hydroxybenzoate polyprenyltransferase